MTLNELIERLESLRDDYGVDGDSDVRGAFQPNYPLVARIDAITTINGDDEVTIYIALADAREYGSEKLWEDCWVEQEDEDEE